MLFISILNTHPTKHTQLIEKFFSSQGLVFRMLRVLVMYDKTKKYETKSYIDTLPRGYGICCCKGIYL